MLLDRNEIKSRLEKVDESQPEIWSETLSEVESFAREKAEVIWAGVDFAKEGKLEKAMKIVDYFRNNEDPSIESDINQRVLKGEDVRNISTIRGTLPWLLQEIVMSLNTHYYPKVIDVVEELANDPAVYVRQQATVSVAFLAANLKATKNKDESPFDFRTEDRNRVYELAFKMLRENKKYPRVLEYLTSVFSYMRWLKEDDAREVLSSFIYKDDGTLQEDYILERMAPLVIYYAVFRSDLNDGFDSSWSEQLLEKIIADSPNRIKATIIWLFWKAIEEDKGVFPRLKKYVSIFLQEKLESTQINQLDFLIHRIIDVYPDDAVDFLVQYLNQVYRFSQEQLIEIRKEIGHGFTNQQLSPRFHVWLHDIHNVLEKVAVQKPEMFIIVLGQIKSIAQIGVYIGDVHQIFQTYKLLPEETQSKVEGEIRAMYSELQSSASLPPLL